MACLKLDSTFENLDSMGWLYFDEEDVFLACCRGTLDSDSDLPRYSIRM